jgi:hypothetical protein
MGLQPHLKRHHRINDAGMFHEDNVVPQSGISKLDKKAVYSIWHDVLSYTGQISRNAINQVEIFRT